MDLPLFCVCRIDFRMTIAISLFRITTEYTLVWPDGRQQVLLSVPKFDFNWQLHYELAEPMKIPAGSKIQAIAHYDNSIKNRYNPAPQKEVFWSEQSWDEMFIPWFEYTVDSKDLTQSVKR